jgi:hypothetical protein
MKTLVICLFTLMVSGFCFAEECNEGTQQPAPTVRINPMGVR